MKTKAVKRFVAPEARLCFTIENSDGELMPDFVSSEKLEGQIKVRIIRERDYQKLLKLARKAK